MPEGRLSLLSGSRLNSRYFIENQARPAQKNANTRDNAQFLLNMPPSGQVHRSKYYGHSPGKHTGYLPEQNGFLSSEQQHTNSNHYLDMGNRSRVGTLLADVPNGYGSPFSPPPPLSTSIPLAVDASSWQVHYPRRRPSYGEVDFNERYYPVPSRQTHSHKEYHRPSRTEPKHSLPEPSRTHMISDYERNVPRRRDRSATRYQYADHGSRSRSFQQPTVFSHNPAVNRFEPIEYAPKYAENRNPTYFKHKPAPLALTMEPSTVPEARQPTPSHPKGLLNTFDYYYIEQPNMQNPHQTDSRRRRDHSEPARRRRYRA